MVTLAWRYQQQQLQSSAAAAATAEAWFLEQEVINMSRWIIIAAWMRRVEERGKIKGRGGEKWRWIFWRGREAAVYFFLPPLSPSLLWWLWCYASWFQRRGRGGERRRRGGRVSTTYVVRLYGTSTKMEEGDKKNCSKTQLRTNDDCDGVEIKN